MLTIEHTHVGGTLLHGTSRGDGSAEVLRTRPGGSYWKWSRNVGDGGAWFIVRSRDNLPNHYRINRTADALREAGFDVELDVSDESRSTAEVVEGQRERAGDRAEALHAKAERKQAEGDAAWSEFRRIADGIPMGQPILVGHHSERRHRKDLERQDRALHKTVESHDEARDAERRAQLSERKAAGRESRTTVANRVKKLGAEVAKDLRTLHGHWRRWGESQDVERDETTGRYVLVFRAVDPDSSYGQRLTARIVSNTDTRLYWSEVLAGMSTDAIGPDTVKNGDVVKSRGRWYRVARVNAKSASVETGYSWTDRIPWAEITAHRAATSEPTPVELDA